MLEKLKKMFRRSGRYRQLNAQVSELTLAVATLMHAEKSADRNEEGVVAVERMLIHAAKSHVDSETIKSLYGSVACRLAEAEQEIEHLKEEIVLLKSQPGDISARSNRPKGGFGDSP